MNYEEFLASKTNVDEATGLDVIPDLNPSLFDWQKDVVAWALRRGRSAIFADCGLGKTIMQLEWAKHVPGRVLILAPLAVAPQTIRESEKFGIGKVKYCRDQSAADTSDATTIITNYEMLDRFDHGSFSGVVLDESSILKSYTGTTKRALIESFRETEFKLACTATPAPNDHMELGNHSEFLGVMRSPEMLSRWFINDTMHAGNYRLKKHAVESFWEWVHSWALSLEKPSDLGGCDDGFILPGLRIVEHVIDAEDGVGEMLFPEFETNLSATQLHRVMRRTAPGRAKIVADLVNGSSESWVIWCHTNYEADELRARIPDAVEVRGSDSTKTKEERLSDFSQGRIRAIITKPSIAGFGLNWQHAARVAFVGLSYSFESYYQAVRRTWRFGQDRPVVVNIVRSEHEGPVRQTIIRKEGDYESMKNNMLSAMRRLQLDDADRLQLTSTPDYDTESGPSWDLHRGDCVRVLRDIDADSVGLSIHSPPFSSLYIYSDGLEDMGNSSDHDEFFEHYRYAIRELFRVTKRGRIAAVHCKDLPLYKNRDGAAGLYDFPGDVIRVFSEEGWTFHSRCTIWKSPVTEMQRTKNHGLLYKQLRKDSCASRQGMADYLLAFRKWDGQDEFPDPVPHEREGFPLDQWQEWASPVWMDIKQTEVLNGRSARSEKDERHICPLQLEVIRRAVRLWSNPGDLVLSPFAGIGSEGVVAIEEDRRFVGAELKESYFRQACRNLEAARAIQGNLFETAAS